MARFSSDLGAQRFPTRVDALKATAIGAHSIAGAGTFIRPTPPRSPREGSAAPGRLRHRHLHSFSDLQESLDGAYDGDIGDSPSVPRPSTVAAASADAAATSGAVSALRLNASPAAAARNSVPPAAASASAASASAVATSPTEAMPPGRSRSHGSDTMGRRRLTRHRRTQSVEAVMEYYGLTEQALTLTPMGTPMGTPVVQASSVKRVTSTGQVRSVKQAASMTPSSSSPFPRVYMAVQSPHGLRRARSAGKQSPREPATCFLKLPCSGPSPASSVSSSPLKPLSVKQSPRDAAEFSLKSPCSRPSPPSSASSPLAAASRPPPPPPLPSHRRLNPSLLLTCLLLPCLLLPSLLFPSLPLPSLHLPSHLVPSLLLPSLLLPCLLLPFLLLSSLLPCLPNP
ncbi:unnamed protein product [Closterium sp. Naga37s-1]|nr:unnamed protein product [Closterium sp. Naga37s-1]